MTTTGRRTCMLAIESSLAAPVSCSAIRKSDAVRTPCARPCGKSSTVGPTRARGERDVIEAQRERVLGVERAAEAHAAVQREAVAPLEQQPDHLEEVLVPAHRDAVLGDAAEARHHAIVERLGQRRDVARSARTARARRAP